MRIHKSILLYAIAAILFLAGCNKPAAPEVSRASAHKKIDTGQTEQLEKQEIEPLLKELRRKNPFSLDHSGGLSMATTGGTDLKGIIWDIKRPFALVGNKVVAEGDTADGKKVIKINKDSVVLDNQGKEEILKLELTP